MTDLNPILDDPFFTTKDALFDQGDPFGITAGRYRLPDLFVNPDGSLVTGTVPKKGGRRRVTTEVKAIGDSKALGDWQLRRAAVGFVLREDLYDLMCVQVGTDPEDKDAIDKIVRQAMNAAGADMGANLGTAFHGFTEGQDLGVASFARRRWHAKLANYASNWEAYQLQVIPEYVERKVVVERYNLAGTLDRIVLDLTTGVLHIDDTKTQKTFWTWIETAAQLAAYQLADAMWNKDTCLFEEMPATCPNVAIVNWCPEKHPGRPDAVDLFDVDLERGREALSLAVSVNALRSEAKAKGQTWGTLRPLPALGVVETYAARLRDVSTRAEGSALVSEIRARGVWCDELADVARDSVKNLEMTG